MERRNGKREVVGTGQQIVSLAVRNLILTGSFRVT